MKRDYFLILLSTVMTSVIFGLIYPFFSIYARAKSGDYFYSGLIVALPLIVTIAASFAWGALSDRFRKRKAVVVAASLAGCAFFFAFPYLDVRWLIAARCAQVAFLSSAVLLAALVTEYYPSDKGKSLGGYNMAGALGSTIGGLLLGVVVSGQIAGLSPDGVRSFFWLLGGLNILAIALVLPVQDTEMKPVKEGSTGAILRNRTVVLVCLCSGLVLMSSYMVWAVFPAYISDNYISDTKSIGVFVSLASAMSIFVFLAAGYLCDRLGRKWVFVGATAAYILCDLGYGFATGLWQLAVLWALPIWPFFWISANSIMSDVTSGSERGRGLGLLTSVAQGLGGFAGSISGGIALGALGFRSLCVIAACTAAAALAVSLLLRETGKV